MIPTIDPQVKHVGVSYLRRLNANNLRDLSGAIVLCENSEPLAVIVSVETYFRLQQQALDRTSSLKDISGIAGSNSLANRYLDARREKADTKR